jgi:hypothetical protein
MEEETLPLILSRESSNSLGKYQHPHPNKYDSTIINYELNSDNYTDVLNIISREYEDDCEEDIYKDKDVDVFEYLSKLNVKNPNKKDIRKIKKGLKYIERLSDNCYILVNTQDNLNLIDVFLNKIICRLMYPNSYRVIDPKDIRNELKPCHNAWIIISHRNMKDEWVGIQNIFSPSKEMYTHLSKLKLLEQEDGTKSKKKSKGRSKKKKSKGRSKKRKSVFQNEK